MGVYVQTADSCDTDVPVKFFEHPNTSAVKVDTCTHKSDYSTIKTDVDACKALDAQGCIGKTKCRILQAREKVFEGHTWEMVKWLPASSTHWFSTDDNLAGTAKVGTIGDSSNEWSMPFDLSKFTYFMFMKDDYYQIMDKAFLNIDPTTGLPTLTATSPVQRDMLKSTNRASPS
jgi:hypothetical protein